MTARDQVFKKIQEVCKLASELFGVQIEDTLTIDIRNCGTSAGTAAYQRQNFGSVTRLTLTLNEQLVNDQDVYKLLEDTIPHEIAHLVCYLRPELGKNHDKGWKRVCIMLGGNGNRCHQYDLKKARRTRKAVYNIYGQETNIGLTVHKRIQAGRNYSIKKGGQRVRICPTQFTGKVKLV